MGPQRGGRGSRRVCATIQSPPTALPPVDLRTTGRRISRHRPPPNNVVIVIVVVVVIVIVVVVVDLVICILPEKHQGGILVRRHHHEQWLLLLLRPSVRVARQEFVAVFLLPVLDLEAQLGVRDQAPVPQRLPRQRTRGVPPIQPLGDGLALKAETLARHEGVCVDLQRQGTDEALGNLAVVVVVVPFVFGPGFDAGVVGVGTVLGDAHNSSAGSFHCAWQFLYLWFGMRIAPKV
mmetsp:Transcript_2670/g.7121  ORF Transcript_2670/g.7121 Transcript_2670/m.7121 type:complete len:235 (-) Transcript_2670:290-994(-)